jgi:HK97 family phage major capsid protein
MDMTEIKRALEETFGAVKDAQNKTAEEIRAELKALADKVAGQDVNLIDLGQKLAGLSEGGKRETKCETIGEVFVKSDAFKAMQNGGSAGRARILLEGEQLKAVAPIFGDHDPNQFPIEPERLAGIKGPPENDVWVRDLIPGGRTTSNMIEYVREKAFQNNADYQYPEGSLKAQSDLSFEQVQAPVVTIAHWILASRQVLDDAPMLQSYINSRMVYGLRMKTDQEIINGDGAAGHLTGLLKLVGPFAPTDATMNGADNVRLAMAQVQAYFYRPNMIVMNPLDWATLQLMKNAQGNYLFGSPLAPIAPRLWNLNVAETYAMPQGNFLVGDSRQAMVWDRQQISVEVSREDRDNFVKNMVTILVEERLALSVYADAAFAYGALTGGAEAAAQKLATPPKASK